MLRLAILAAFTALSALGLGAATPGGLSGAPAQQPPPDSKPFYRDWTMEDLLPAMADLGAGRSWMKGGRLFEQAACGVCHAFSTYWEGNGMAPDLTAVSSKFTRDIILQSILEPSATINGQYYHTRFRLKDGTILSGSVMDVVDGKILVAPVMLAPHVTVPVAETDVATEEPSSVSPMPAGLLNGFTREQVLDLIAFLDAGGDPEAGVYQK